MIAGIRHGHHWCARLTIIDRLRRNAANRAIVPGRIGQGALAAFIRPRITIVVDQVAANLLYAGINIRIRIIAVASARGGIRRNG